MRRQFLERLVVGTWHKDVNIVIPWDEAMMPCRAKKRPVSRPPTPSMTFANACKQVENLQFFLPDLLAVRRHEKTATDFIMHNITDIHKNPPCINAA